MDNEHFFPSIQRFLAVDDPEQALALVAEAPDELLSDDTLAELDRLLAAETDEQRRAFLAERRELLENLRALRQQFGELQQQIEALPEAERQFLAFMAIPSSLGMAALAAQSDDATLDALEATAAGKLAEAGDEEAAGIQARVDDLRELRAAGREATQAKLDAAQAAANRLADRLIAWIQTPDWGASERYLAEHAADLLSDDSEAALDLLQLANPGNEQIPMHRQLLRFAREQGSAAAYAQLRRELAEAAGSEEAAQALADNPLLRAIVAFIQADDEADRAVLTEQQAVLLTSEAREALQQFAAAARQRGDAAMQARLEARLALWNEAWRGRVAGRLREQAGETRSEAAQDWQERQPASERGDRILVIGNHNSVVMPGGKILNIVNVGELPLQWRYPRETRPELARSAVGREQELAELRTRLLAEGGAALVGKSATAAAPGRAAVRGQPGIGKTVLAAMLATRHADDFPGGVLWLDVGPSKRTEADVAGELQKLAAYAYADPVQAGELLSRCELAPEVVQALLSDHGRLLVVLDDVWSEAVVRRLKAALPADACVLLTTRDYDVAYALEDGAQGIQPLDVLSPPDARLLLQSKAPGLSDDLAGQVAAGLGCHAQALTLAAAALARRSEFGQSHAATAAELLARVRSGRGFGDLPRQDKEDQVTPVEIAYRYSYDYIGEDGRQGGTRQAWLRGLGAFAQEADFDAAAAAAVWDTGEGDALRFIELLAGLALVQPAKLTGRWQQHAILRAYALSLQDQDERLALADSHAEFYVNLARACYREVPRNNERVEQEFKQIEHAFDWCLAYSPTRAVELYGALSDFMTNRGRSELAMQWGQAALESANRIGVRLGTANTLQSLGDLERRLGNIDQARQHYDDALRLYLLEQEPGGIINTLVAQARLEAGEGNVDQAKGLYEQAFQVADRTGFADHPVVQGMRQEYAMLEGLASIQQDPLAMGLAALMHANNDQALTQTLTEHPILYEAKALLALAGLLDQALQAQQDETVAQLMVLLAALLGVYNQTHTEQIDPKVHEAVIELCQQVTPLAQELDADLAALLRRQAGWACNTLGNHYADQDKDIEQAIAAYTGGLAFDPSNAMLLRNRAGAHIDRSDLSAAQADVDAAAALEPDALRLANLRKQLEELEELGGA